MSAASTSSASERRSAVAALQTAASMEILARANYLSGLPLDQVRAAPPLVRRFTETTANQHYAHLHALNDAVVALGGKAQLHPDVVVAGQLTRLLPRVPNSGLGAVVEAAIFVEERLLATHVAYSQQMSDAKLRSLFGSIAGVEAQHLAVLLNTKALLAGSQEQQIQLPPPHLKLLPPASSTDALPTAFAATALARPRAEGAVG